jgi:tRNA pseudouridine55 synthase
MPLQIIPFYKNMGETPLSALERLRKEQPEYLHMPLTYAGRLDPLAEGLLIILAGEECMKKDEYTLLPKEYEVKVLFGFETDTYDVLGLINTESSFGTEFPSAHIISCWKFDLLGSSACARLPGTQCLHSLSETLQNNFIGDIDQAYPPYSSRTVNGKPLFQWAREGRLNEIEIPNHKVHVESIEIKKVETITEEKLHKYIQKVVALVKGDFRQDEILKKWGEALVGKQEEYQVVTLRISCSSGTYVRSIAYDLGRTLGVPALALHIKRTKIGDFKI